MGKTISLGATAGLNSSQYSLSHSSVVLSKFPSPSTTTSVIPGGLPGGATQIFIPEDPDSLVGILSQANIGCMCPFMVIIGQGSKTGSQMDRFVAMQPYFLLTCWLLGTRIPKVSCSSYNL